MNASVLNKKCRGHWGQILRILASELIPALNRAPRHGPCPLHGGKDGFRFFDDYQQTGGAICNTCGGFSTGLKLLTFVHDWTLKEAYQQVDQALSQLPPGETEWTADTVEDDEEWDQGKMDAIQSLLYESVSLSDPDAEPARVYLANRGLSLDEYPDALRFHPEIPYWEDGVQQAAYPCLLSLVDSAKDVVSSIHRTFLTVSGERAPVSVPKKLMPSPSPGWTKGAAVRLDEPEVLLAVAEGVETALAVRQATKQATWAAVSANGMERLIVPSPVSEVWIWADRDRSSRGQVAAGILAKRLRATGCRVHVRVPPCVIPHGQKSIDWLDVLNMDVD